MDAVNEVNPEPETPAECVNHVDVIQKTDTKKKKTPDIKTPESARKSTRKIPPKIKKKAEPKPKKKREKKKTPAEIDAENETPLEVKEEDVHSLFDYLRNCVPAAAQITYIEEGMSENYHDMKHPCIQQLEKNLLKLGSDPELTQGVFYHMTLESNGRTVTRYFESGSYYGFMEKTGKTLLATSCDDELNLLRVYTLGDIQSKVFKQVQRPRVQYLKLLQNNELSVVNQIPLIVQGFNNNSSVQLVGLKVHVLRKRAHKDNVMDRFLYVYPEDDSTVAKTWTDAFTDHVISYCPPTPNRDASPYELLSKGRPETVAEQFNFISAISNNHWRSYLRRDGSKSCGLSCAEQHLLFQKPNNYVGGLDNTKYHPTSLRNRLFFDFVNRSKCSDGTYATKLCHGWLANSQQGIQEHMIKQRESFKRKLVSTRVVKVDLASVFVDCELPIPINMAEERSLYTEFCENLVADGVVIIRSLTRDGGVLIMNGITSDGDISPSKFEHIEYVNMDNELRVQCTCSQYDIVQKAGRIRRDIPPESLFLDQSCTCLHCRFCFNHLYEVCQDITMLRLQPDTVLMQGLKETKANSEKAVLLLNCPLPGNVINFSVQGMEELGVQFVNLSRDRKTITCQSGLCAATRTNRRTTQTILDLTDLDKVCPHLRTMSQNTSEWKLYLSHSTEVDQDGLFDHPINVKLGKDDVRFDVETEMWESGSLSQHKPQDDLSPTLIRCTAHRATVNDGNRTRDTDGYIIGDPLRPTFRSECKCGAGYDELLGYMFAYSTNLYTRYGAVKCDVETLTCKQLSPGCAVKYTGEYDCVHQWTKESCAGDEMAWDFHHSVQTSKISFSAYVKQKNRIYQSTHLGAAKFMSAKTFIRWYFSWTVALRRDYRTERDEFCGDNPDTLVCDGTHVGVALRMVDYSKNTVTKADLAETVVPKHKRYNRVFLPYQTGTASHVRKVRNDLFARCQQYLKNTPAEESTTTEDEILELCLEYDTSVHVIVSRFLSKSYPLKFLKCVAGLLKSLLSDAALGNFLPWSQLALIRKCVLDLSNRTNCCDNFVRLEDLSPQFCSALRLARSCGRESDVGSMILFLCGEVEKVHATDTPYPPGNPILNSYNPVSGVAYSFTTHGCQIRKTPVYKIDGSRKGHFDDAPETDRCSKDFPAARKSGFCYMFLWFCGKHGHCYGFHLIEGGEGRKDPFFSLYKYCEKPPRFAIYDFGCSLNEYGLNREPGYFREIEVKIDAFHGVCHVCSTVFRCTQCSCLQGINTEICEQFNAYLQVIKYTASHLTQEHFILFMQFHISEWNRAKTNRHKKEVELAYKCNLI